MRRLRRQLTSVHAQFPWGLCAISAHTAPEACAHPLCPQHSNPSSPAWSPQLPWALWLGGDSLVIAGLRASIWYVLAHQLTRPWLGSRMWVHTEGRVGTESSPAWAALSVTGSRKGERTNFVIHLWSPHGCQAVTVSKPIRVGIMGFYLPSWFFYPRLLLTNQEPGRTSPCPPWPRERTCDNYQALSAKKEG
jgi:hypothetical protein